MSSDSTAGQRIESDCYPLRGTTAALFGAALSQMRAARSLSPDVMMHDTDITEEWLASVERGEIDLTAKMVISLQHALNTALRDAAEHAGAALTEPPMELHDEVVELHRYPFGPRALELRAMVTGSVDEGAPTATPNSGRLLVLAPAVVFFSMMLLTLGVLREILETADVEAAEHSLEWARSIADFIGDIVWPIVVVGMLGAIFGAHVADAILRSGSRSARSTSRNRMLRSVRNYFAARGVEWTTSAGLDLEDVAAFLIPRHRANARDAGRRARLAERVEFVMSLSCAMAGYVWLVELVMLGPSKHTLLPTLLLVLTFALWWAVGSEANQESRVCGGAVARGLGIMVSDEPTH
jgi:hypothetical protein